MIVVRFEPEAVGDGTMDGGALVVPRAVRGTVVESEGGDVEMERNVGSDVWDREMILGKTESFLCTTASSVEEDVSSIVSLQGCFTSLTPLPLCSAPLFWRGSPRSCQRRPHHLLSATPDKKVHVLRDAANAVLHLLQHGGRGACSRLTFRVPTLLQSSLDAVLHFLHLQPIFS